MTEAYTPFNLIVCGRIIGTATWWDQNDTMIFGYSNFIPIEGIIIPACENLVVDYYKGAFEIYDENGNIEKSFDIFEVLNCIAKAPSSELE